jgi:hypothetical protein
MLRPRLSTVMRYARTTQFNWPDIWRCGVRQELKYPSSYVPTTGFLKRPAWKEFRFWIRPRDPRGLSTSALLSETAMRGGWNFAEAFGHGLVHAHGARDDPQEHAVVRSPLSRIGRLYKKSCAQQRAQSRTIVRTKTCVGTSPFILTVYRCTAQVIPRGLPAIR